MWPRLKDADAAPVRDVVYSELARDHIQTGSEFIIMRRCREWKLVLYLDDAFGELYDLVDDPGETRNRWRDEACREVRERLRLETLDWYLKSTLKAGRKPGRKPQTALQP